MTNRGRLNARLDPEMERKVAYLRRRTGLGTSEIVRAAIDNYYAAIQGGGAQVREILEASGFIGSGAGPSDLSENYKDEFSFDVDRKHS